MIRYSDYFSLPHRGKDRVGTERSGTAVQSGLHRAPKSRTGSRPSAQRAGFKKRPKRKS